MIEIPLRRRDGTLHGFALIDDEDAHLAQRPWFLHSAGYVCANVTVARGKRRQVLLHREVMGLEVGDPLQVDHKDGNKLDNRRSNLRVGTAGENMQNRHVVLSATGYRGVSLHKSGLYMAHIRIDGKQVRTAYRKTAEEAANVAAGWRAELMPFSQDAQRAA